MKKDEDLVDKYKGIYDIQQFGLQVKLDVSTRWNTIHYMIKRFLELRDPINHTLLHYKKTSMYPNDDEITILEEMAEALEVMEVGTRQLCERTTTLAKADKIFELVIGDLKAMKGDFAQALLEKTIQRIEERRLPKLSTLQAYLKNLCFFEELEVEGYDGYLTYPPLDDVCLSAKTLYDRLYPKENQPSEPQEVSMSRHASQSG